MRALDLIMVAQKRNPLVLAKFEYNSGFSLKQIWMWNSFSCLWQVVFVYCLHSLRCYVIPIQLNYNQIKYHCTTVFENKQVSQTPKKRQFSHPIILLDFDFIFYSVKKFPFFFFTQILYFLLFKKCGQAILLCSSKRP